MKKRYLQESVYSALLGRLKYIFEEFDNIFVSFSGGKDSGLLLEMTLDFQKMSFCIVKKQSKKIFQNMINGITI